MSEQQERALSAGEASEKDVRRAIVLLRLGILLGLMMVLAACGNASSPAAVLTPTAVPSREPTAHPTAPTAAPVPSPTLLAPTTAPPAATTAAQGAIPQGVTPEGDHFFGQADAPVTMVDFSDFLCTTCRAFAVDTEAKIVERYITTGKVKLVFHHLLQLGPGSVRTAEAAECAADQGKFWPMHDMLYARQDEVFRTSDLDTTLVGFGRDLGLDTAAFSDCLTSHKHLAAVQAADKAAQAAGVRFRPTIDINGVRLTGALPFATYQKAIDAALAGQ
jgi:protein-disulfide isomerase